MNKKNKKVVCLTDEQWERIQKGADECNMKVATYMQMMLTNGQVIKCDFNEIGVLKEMIDMKNELKNIGDSISQISDKVNATNKVSKADMDMFQKKFNSLENEYAKIVSYVQDYLAKVSDSLNELIQKGE